MRACNLNLNGVDATQRSVHQGYTWFRVGNFTRPHLPKILIITLLCCT